MYTVLQIRRGEPVEITVSGYERTCRGGEIVHVRHADVDAMEATGPMQTPDTSFIAIRVKLTDYERAGGLPTHLGGAALDLSNNRVLVVDDALREPHFLVAGGIESLDSDSLLTMYAVSGLSEEEFRDNIKRNKELGEPKHVVSRPRAIGMVISGDADPLYDTADLERALNHTDDTA